RRCDSAAEHSILVLAFAARAFINRCVTDRYEGVPMGSRFLPLMFLSLVVPSLVAHSGAATGLMALQGEWKAIALESAGEAETPEYLKRIDQRILVQGDEMTFRSNGEKDIRCKFKLDASKSPQWLDLMVLEGSEAAKGKTVPGICSLDKGRLRICLPPGPDFLERPKAFKTTGEKGERMLTLERAK